MKNRVFRAPDAQWDAAVEAADDKDEVLSEELREFIKRYPTLPKRER